MRTMENFVKERDIHQGTTQKRNDFPFPLRMLEAILTVPP